MDWQEDILMGGFAMLLAILVYTVVHMLINRIRGRDELEGLFRFRANRKKNKSS